MMVFPSVRQCRLLIVFIFGLLFGSMQEFNRDLYSIHGEEETA